MADRTLKEYVELYKKVGELFNTPPNTLKQAQIFNRYNAKYKADEVNINSEAECYYRSLLKKKILAMNPESCMLFLFSPEGCLNDAMGIKTDEYHDMRIEEFKAEKKLKNISDDEGTR